MKKTILVLYCCHLQMYIISVFNKNPLSKWRVLSFVLKLICESFFDASMQYLTLFINVIIVCSVIVIILFVCCSAWPKVKSVLGKKFPTSPFSSFVLNSLENNTKMLTNKAYLYVIKLVPLNVIIVIVTVALDCGAVVIRNISQLMGLVPIA